jgi:hypothetical protein
MLRINYSPTKTGQQWTLCGRLAGPWVQELRSCWEDTRQIAAGSQDIIDLTGVTFIDENGERVLADMHDAGVSFVAGGVETQHVIDNLKLNGERQLRRIIGLAPCNGESQDKGQDKGRS